MDGTGYIVDNPVQKKFLQNPKFCLCLQNYVENIISVPIAVIPQYLSENQRNVKKSSNGYTIQLLGTHENRAELEQIVSDFIKNLFQTIQSKIFNDNKVKEWLHRPSIVTNHIKCLQKLMNDKIYQVFTVCEDDGDSSLKIYYLAKEPFSVCHSEEIDKIIQNKILQETILLPLRYEQSGQLKNELKRLAKEIATKENVSVSFVFVESQSKRMQKEIVLFGYYKIVNRLKQEFLKMIEKHQLLTFKLNSLNAFQTDFLVDTCSRKLRKIEHKYVDVGVELRLRENEFRAPQYLKDEIGSRITQLLSHSTTITFKSIQLSKDIAEQAEKHLKSIAHKNHCYIKTELEYKSRCYTIPKGFSSNTQVSKSIIEQSDQFRRSSNLFIGIIIKNGSIEVHTGDIALQKIDTIVISTTFNGLKEGVIERAGRFDYQHTYEDTSDTQFTETNGGTLSCKKILFSNWIPSTISNDENELRKSIEVFMLKSIEYTIKDKNSTSIAFAVSDSCQNEMILAQEMIAVAISLLESRNLQLKISFVLLPEQETLHNHFFTILDSMQDIYIQFEWSTAIIKVTLIASQVEDSTKCQEKIENYLKRCTTLSKMVNPNGIFEHWSQHTINAFYKYCKDKCVLPHIDKTRNKIELIGLINNVLEVKQKLSFLSVNNGIVREQSKVHNIMISFCQQDQRMCQRLVNRLIEEGFSVWAEPINNEQQRDVSSRMNKSDCIILCISKNSYQSQSCEKEANYAFQTGKLVFLVKIQNNPLVDWQRKVFEGKLFFQFFGSENHLDLEFGRLLLEILRQTQPGYLSILRQRSSRQQQEDDESQMMLTIEERRAKYDAKIRKLTEIGRINEKEMKILIEQLQNVINDVAIKTEEERKEKENERFSIEYQKKKSCHWKYFNSTEQLVCCAKRWLRKSTNVTKQNLPPFSASGDINDVPFPIPEDILDNRDRDFRTFLPSAFGINEHSIVRVPPRILYGPVPIDDELTYGLCTRKTGYDDNLFQIFSEVHSIDDFIPRKTMSSNWWSLASARWATGYSRKSIITSSRTEKSVQKRHIFNKPNKMKDGPEQNASKPIKNYVSLTQEEVDAYKKKFAQRMHENVIEFEKFCSTYVATE